MTAPTVAIDVTPLIGVRTGVGHAVASAIAAVMVDVDPPGLRPYALSLRARDHRDELPEGTIVPPVPARIALAAWPRLDRPSIDRWLGDVDVVHATNYLVPPSRHPTVVTVHDCAFVRYPELAVDDVGRYEAIVRRAVHRGATVHVPSEFVAHEVDEIFGPGLIASGRVVTIPWGIPPILPDRGMSDDIAHRIDGRPFVLALGTVEPRKNLPHLVAAFGRYATTDPESVLIVAGPDGSASTALAMAVDALPSNIAARVIRVGAVTERDRSALLHRARTLAYPSISEGFGFPVLEAMLAGTPVVAARAGSIPEIAGDAARLVDATDEDALATALSDLADDATASEFAARGRRRADQFDWSTTGRGLVSLYQAVT